MSLRVVIRRAIARPGDDPETLYYSPTMRIFSRRGRHVQLSPMRSTMLLEIAARGGYVTPDAFIDTLYGDDEDGGPDSARGGVYVRIAILRNLIKPLGLMIHAHWCVGYRIAEAA